MASLQNEGLFDENERGEIRANTALLITEIRQAYQHAVDNSHHGRPHPVTWIHTGQRGRPRAVIDCEWLTWAISMRSTSHIAQYLQVSRPVVRAALLEYGLREQSEDPFLRSPSQGNPYRIAYTQRRSYTSPVSQLSDEQLDDMIARIRIHFPSAGVSMLYGYLRTLEQTVPRERIRLSLLRINPVQRLFGRSAIERRTYTVPGPNYLWHHDGQHGEHNSSVTNPYVYIVLIQVLSGGALWSMSSWMDTLVS